MNRNGNPRSVVGNTHNILGQKSYFYFVASSRHRLIPRVVKNLYKEVVQPLNSGRTDIHSRPFPDRFKSFENDYIFSVIFTLLNLIFSHIYASSISYSGYDGEPSKMLFEKVKWNKFIGSICFVRSVGIVIIKSEDAVCTPLKSDQNNKMKLIFF